MKISVIIPAYNEEALINETLDDLLTHHSPFEAIVADGGSTDRTAEIAEEKARVIRSPKGRAAQMNAGAREAKGDILLFLHSDTLLPTGGLDEIRDTISSGFKAGRFHMKFDDERFWLRFFSSYSGLHIFSYGDQGFFLTRELFDRLGGYREDVPFEDVDFYKRLRKVTKPKILKSATVTSSRRFLKTGCLRQKGINVFLTVLYVAGIDVTRSKRKYYPDIR